MSCTTLTINGIRAMVCRARPQTKKWCKFCRANGRQSLATKLCDALLPNGKTCDAGLCDRHARPAGENQELCPIHNGEVAA